MRKIMLLTPIAASAALVLLTAGPAFALPGETATTFELTGGSLAITVPETAVLTPGPPTVGGATIAGALGVVTVTDTRGSIAGWVASALSSAFVGSVTTVPASAVSYASTVAATDGTVSVAGAAAPNLSAASVVETATAAVGANSATWNPNVSVLVPEDALNGAYAATLTHSVL